MPHQAVWIVNVERIRLRPEYTDHVCSDDFVEDRAHNGRKIRMLNVIDEFTPECIAIRVERKLKTVDIIDVLSDPSYAASPPIFVPKASRSSSPRCYGSGSRWWMPRPPKSRQAAVRKRLL